MRIEIPVYDGLDELDALGPLEVFRNAERMGADLSVRLVTLVECTAVTGSHGLTFQPDGVYQPGAELVVVPGGGWAARQDVGTWGEVQRGDWLAPLAAAATGGSVM